MTSEVGICNLALDRIGADPIVALIDDTTEANLCDRVYPIIRDTMLGIHPWKFATGRAILAQTSNTPLFSFNNEFQLPSDYMKMVLFNGFLVGRFTFLIGSASSNAFLDFLPDLAFRREGDKLLTNDDEANLVYIKAITDAGSFDDVFVEVFAARLAWHMSYALTLNRGLVRDIKEEYEFKIQEATAANSQEDIEQQIEHSGYLDARL